MNIQRKLKLAIWLIIPLCALLFAAVFTGKIHHSAGEIGAAAGQRAGNAVGWAIGSADGAINGTKAGREAGKEAGLSAEDTSVDIEGGITAIGKLEVLAANVSMKNLNKLGDDYASLYLVIGNAVFSVDLEDAKVFFSKDGKTVCITLPKPELDIHIDQSRTEKLAEKQNFSLTDSAEDGLKDYINSMGEIEKEAKEHIQNYESLLDEAEASAIKQVELLVSMLCGSSYSVQVNFE